MPPKRQDGNQYHCQICDINCRSEARYNKHVASTAHQLASQKVAQQQPPPPPPPPEPAPPAESYYCEVCRIDCKTEARYQRHLSATAHQMLALQAEKQEQRQASKEEEEEDDDDDSDGEIETFCKVCNIDCKTESGFQKHTMGMAHIMRAQSVGNVEKCKANTQKVTDIKERAKTAYRCDPCGFIFSDKEKYDQHIMNNKNHPKKVYIHKMGGGIEAFTDGMEVTELDEVPQCMEKMTSCGKPLIGLEHIVEIRRVHPLNPPYYACLLCKEPIAELIPHICNREHRKNYCKLTLPKNFEMYQTLCPGPDHEYYGWFRAIYMKDSSYYEKEMDEPVGEKRKDVPKRWESEFLTALTSAIFSHEGFEGVQVVQENLGQKPRRWPKGNRGMLLRPTTPPVRDPNEVHTKGVDKWQAKRIYVGNIPDACPWEDLKDFFQRQIVELQLGTGEGLTHVTVNEEKKFAFLQFQTPEEATSCLELNGICFQGNYLNLKRPSQYKETPEDIKRRQEQQAKKPIQGRQGQHTGQGANRGGKRPNDGHQNPNQKWGRYDDYNYTSDYYGYEDYYGYGADYYSGYGTGQYGATKGAASGQEGYGSGNRGNQGNRWQEENGVKYGAVGSGGYNQKAQGNQQSYQQDDYGYQQGNNQGYGQDTYEQYGASQQTARTGQQQARAAQQQPMAGQQQPRTGQQQPVGSQQQPRPGQQQPMGGQQQPRPGQQQPRSDQQQARPGQQQPWADQQQPRQAQQQQPPAAQQQAGEGQGQKKPHWTKQQPTWVPRQPPPPPDVSVPPPPAIPENLMQDSLTKAYNLLQKNSISSDGEHRMATQVLNLIKQKIEKFKAGETTGTLPKIKMPEKTGVLEWLRFLVKLLAKGFLANEEERKTAEDTMEVLTLRMSTYQTGTPAMGMQPQQAAGGAMQTYGQGYANASAGYMGYPGYGAYNTYAAAYGQAYSGTTTGYNYTYY